MFKKISITMMRKVFSEILSPIIFPLVFTTIFLAAGFSNPIEAKIKVVTTSTDLASIARVMGGGMVEVNSLAQGSDDLHFLAARPDFILKASKADVLIQIGLELEIGWLPLVIEKSRNAKIKKGGAGFCDVSQSIKAKKIPQGELNRSMGDVHLLGNSHYWSDPLNGIRMASHISSCLSKVDPSNSHKYKQNYQAFSNQLKTKIIEWSKRLQKHSGKKVITYHDEFVYLLERFQIKEQGHIEAIPGVTPGMARVREIVETIRREKIRLVLVSPWSNYGMAQKIAAESGAKIVILPIQSGAVRSNESYLEMLENCVTLLEKNL